MNQNTTEIISDINPVLGTLKKRLGEEMIQRGTISNDQLSIALKEQKKSDNPLGETLISLGFITETILRDALSEILGKDSIDLSNVVPDNAALALIPKHLSIRFNIIPLCFDEKHATLSIAMTDIYNLLIIDRLRAVVGNRIEIIPLLSGESEISNAIDQFYGYELSVDGILHEIETGEVDYSSLDAEGDAYSQPLVRLVDAILADAVKRGSSDIHFEPEAGFLRLRFRIDGVLHQVRSIHKDYWSAIVVRLKVMSKMNIAETRAPQDGRINLNIRGHQIDFRVSSQPTTYGENIVLRVLDRAKGIVSIDELGLNEVNLTQLKLMMARPEGIILVTGPTGSGKTTTLYSMLAYVRSVEINIMTLEDPVEYPMDMVRQTSINEVHRMNFANGIRSLMRQDPDIILVGEIRDEDTAKMALRAAMTGHQVYSTLHSNSAISSITRLIDIGLNARILSGNIIGIIGQRLIRKLCTHCKISHPATRIEQTLLGVDTTLSINIYVAVGCSKCDHTGYKGRLAILEVLKIDSWLDEMIVEQLSTGKIKKHLREKNFQTLADDAVRRIIEGITTLDEISRVVDLTDRL